MLDDKVLKLLNEQITKEFYSGYLYMAMAGYFEDQNLAGFAHWMRMQGQEESCHALIFFNYVCERGGRIALGAIEQPQAAWDSPLAVFEAGVEHEKLVTASINNIGDAAVEVRDHATQSMLNWFYDEQVEEEASFDEIRAKLERVGDGNGLYMLDEQLAQRVFNVPSPLAGGEA
jgi:ferritin